MTSERPVELVPLSSSAVLPGQAFDESIPVAVLGVRARQRHRLDPTIGIPNDDANRTVGGSMSVALDHFVAAR